MMSKTISLNINYRPQLLVGLVLGIWLYCFLVLVGPFDAGELSLSIRTILMLGYGLLFFLSYAILIPIQNKLYNHWGKWKLGYEIAMVALFCMYSLPICFAYYKTEIVNGTYSFANFSLNIYLPIIALLLPVIFVGRYLVSRQEREVVKIATHEGIITLRGENKLDILKVAMSDLVALEAANNYVAVYYIMNGKLQKKLLRTSLRKIHNSVPEMTQVHRSYLVNFQHFIEWQDSLTLGMTQISIPVSQKYKPGLLKLSLFAPK